MPYINTGDILTQASFTTLSAKINEARTKYGLAHTSTITTGVTITASKITEYASYIRGAHSSSGAGANINISGITDASVGTLLSTTYLNILYDKAQEIYAYCSCNCNHCACNCNYYTCTCDCNYGCTCDCNYGCTCNCNHSGCGGDEISN